MDLVSNLILMGLIFSAAVLYSSVGHAGASGYLAAMALVGVAPLVMKPSALVLNILVATVSTAKFYRAGCFSWRLFWPFAAASVPLAFVGGIITIPGHAYKVVVGTVLLFAAYRLWFGVAATTKSRSPSVPLALLFGGGIGLLSGLTGVSGGIFLSPLMLAVRLERQPTNLRGGGGLHPGQFDCRPAGWGTLQTYRPYRPKSLCGPWLPLPVVGWGPNTAASGWPAGRFVACWRWFWDWPASK